MPLYRIKAPNGLTYQIEGPEGASQEEVAMAVMAKNPDAGKPFKEAGASFGDTALAGLQSAVGATKSTLQGFGAEAPGVETLSNLQKGLSQLYTPERQAEMARRDALEKAAAKSGSTLEEIKAAGAGVTEAPIQATASAVGSSIPTVALSIGAAALATGAAATIGLVGAPALAFAAAVGIGTKYALGALQGAGSVKGSIYDAVKEEVAKQYPDLSKEEVSKIALEAQNFTGKNWDNILAGTGIGAVAGGTGIEKDLLKKLSKPVAEAAAKKAGEEVAKKGIIAATGRGAMAGLKEAVPEGIQGGQEQFAANVAQTREGFETPAMEGVLGAATKEGMMGMLGGSAVHPFTGTESASNKPTVDQNGQPTPNELEALVQKRKLERQQEQMGVKQGREAREGEKILDAEAQAQADQQQVARVEAEKAAATELQTLRAQRQAELEQTFPKDYSDVMQKTDAYAELFQEKQALVNQTQTKEVKARIKTVDGLIQGIIEEDTRVPNEFKRMQAENAKVIKNLPPDLQAKYAATAFTIPEPQQMEIRAATVEQAPVQQTDLLGQPIQQEAPAPAAPDKFKTVQTAAEAQAALDLQNRRDARAGQAERNAAKDAGQLGLFTRVGTPTDEAAVPEPKIIVKKPPVTEPTVRVKPTPETVAPVITADTLGVLGIGPTAVMRKPGHAIQGLDITKPEDAAEVRNMLSIYKEGRSPAIVQKIDTFLGRPEFQALPTPAPVVETAVVTPVVKAPTKTTSQSAEKKAANKATQPSARKVKNEAAKPTAEPAPTPTVTKAVEAPPAPAPIKVVKKTEPKKVEPKKVEPKKEEPKVDKALEKARETADDLDLDPEVTKTKVKSFAKRLHKAGLIDDIGLNAVESISKDKDMGTQDLLDEVKFALDDYERQQKKAPETKPEEKAPVAEEKPKAVPEPQKEQIEKPFNRLTEDQKQELEEFYGENRDSPAFWDKLRADVVTSINKGSKAVAKAIRELVNQIASGVLAAGLIFNPTGLSNQYNINLPKTFQQTIAITAPVPEEAKAKMSPLAQDVYGAMAPVAMKSGKWFMVADKPNGMLHIFKEDGSHFISDATLYGKDKGDVMEAKSSLEGGAKITPAGKFTMKESPADYAGKTSLILVESKDYSGYIAVHAADVSTPSERRLARLETPTAEDNRISYGCINTKHQTFINEIKPNIASLDGGLIFVLPDATETTAGMFAPETEVVERTETPATARAETGRDVAKKEERIEGTEGPTRSRIEKDQEPVANPISNAELEGIVDDVKKSLGGEVEITILDSAKDLDPNAPDGASGLVKDGNVYLFRDGITSGIEGAKTVFHELFHLGLQKLLTNPKEYHRVMNNLYRMNARVREMADKWIASQEGQEAKAAYADMYTNPNDRVSALTAHATDEALARIAEELKTGKKIGTGQRAFVRSIAKWLADVAEKIGMRQVAQNIRSATYTEVEKFVQEAMTAAVGAGPVNMRLTRRFSVPGGIDENTRRAVQAIQDKTPEKYKEPEKKTLVQQLKSVTEVETRDQAKLLARQKTADKFATVSAKVNQLFSKGYKNAFGDLNPMVLARQAEEARKLVLDFFKAGGIKMAKSGLIETVDTKESLQGAVEQLVDLAAKNDMTYKEAESYVSSLLEGHRLYNMREEHDKPLEASALILEQQGKNKEADAERKKKLARHMDNADIDTLEAAFQKSPEIKAILDTLNATRTQAIDLMVAAGRITKEQGQFWKDNSAYVPFDRVFVESETPIKGRGSYGIATLRNLPGMEGSFERPIKNVFDSYTGRLSWMITEAANNNASYNVLDTMALGGFAKELKPKEVPGNKALTVKVYREGKPVEFEVESVADYEAFQAAPELTGWLVGSLIPAARWVRIGVTAFPAFSIKQVIEDAQRSMFNSGVERPLVTGMKTLYNFPRLLTSDALQALGVSKKMPLVRQMEKLGIIGDYDVNIINPAQDIKIAAGAEKRGWSASAYHALEKITKASDLAARLAVFEETLLETGGKKDKDGSITGGDQDLAQLRARELINFSRRGSDPTIRTLSRVVPFMNAYAQGMDVTYRTASGLDSASGSERADARKQFYKMAMKLTALGFMYALAFGDDEGYKNATDEVRDNNFLIPHSDKKIPLPKEIGFLFKSIPERLVNYYRRYGTAEEQSILNLLGTIVKGGVSAYGTPNATPAQIKPILENMTNYSFFLQRELESTSIQKLDPSQRYTPSTSELAKSIGALSQQLGNVAGTKIVEVSPIKVDNLLRGLFGIAGSSTLLMTDALINPSRPDRPLYQMPFASLFVYNTQGGRAKNEFYDLQEKVGQAEMTFKSMQETAPDKAAAYFEKNAAYIAVAPILNNSLQQLSQTRQLRQQLETSSNEQLGMTGKERREAIDDVIKMENESLQYVRMLDKQVRDLSK